MVAIVLVLIGGGGEEEGEGDEAAARGTETSEGTTTPRAGGGMLMAEVIATINVRSGPDEDYPVLGTIRNGTTVEVSGRSEDEEWLQVVYPPRSTLHGWVDAAYLRLEGDASALAVATAEVAAIPEMPTQAPVTAVVTTVTPTPEVTATVPATVEPDLPDLVLTAAYMLEDSLIATVQNQGTGLVQNQAIEVSVLDSQGQTVLGAASVALETLAAGQSIDVNTGFTCSIQERQVLLVVDLNGLVDETDNTNNQLVTTLAPCWHPPPPTLTPPGPSTETSDAETPAP
jgi:SH3-like domain-containing protein